jgi:hypothetical protein
VHALFRENGLELKLRDGATAPIQPPNSDAAAVMIGQLTMGLNPAKAPSLDLAAPSREDARV